MLTGTENVSHERSSTQTIEEGNNNVPTLKQDDVSRDEKEQATVVVATSSSRDRRENLTSHRRS